MPSPRFRRMQLRARRRPSAIRRVADGPSAMLTVRVPNERGDDQRFADQEHRQRAALCFLRPPPGNAYAYKIKGEMVP